MLSTLYHKKMANKLFCKLHMKYCVCVKYVCGRIISFIFNVARYCYFVCVHWVCMNEHSKRVIQGQYVQFLIFWGPPKLIRNLSSIMVFLLLFFFFLSIYWDIVLSALHSYLLDSEILVFQSFFFLLVFYWIISTFFASIYFHDYINLVEIISSTFLP